MFIERSIRSSSAEVPPLALTGGVIFSLTASAGGVSLLVGERVIWASDSPFSTFQWSPSDRLSLISALDSSELVTDLSRWNRDARSLM